MVGEKPRKRKTRGNGGDAHADRGRDTDEILARAEKQGMEAVIPPKKSRRERRDCA